MSSSINIKNFVDDGWLPLSEAALSTPYSAEYLSLLARKRRLPARKIKNVWHVTKSILDEYIEKQKVRIQFQSGELGSSFAEAPDTTPVVATLVSSEPVDLLPKFEKRSEQIRTRRLYVPVALSFIFILGVFFLKSELMSLTPISSLYQSVSGNFNQLQGNAFLSSAVDWFKNIITNRSGKVEKLTEGPYLNNGIVVFPETQDRVLASSNIKNVFSDEVDINFDADGADTGIIVPIFREGDNFDNYAFVLVPVNPASTTTRQLPNKLQ